MTMTRGRTATAAAMLAALVLSACNGDNGGEDPTTPDPTPTTTTAPTDTTPTTAPPDDTTTTSEEPTLSEEEQDEADATAALQAYRTALDAAMTGDASIERIYPYATGTAREQWITQLMSYDAQGLTITGETQLDVVDVSVDGDTAEVVACVDVSDTDVVDEDGSSVVPEDRLARTLTDYVLERNDDAQLGWLVTEDINRDEPCDD